MSDVVVPTIPHLAREEESQWPGDRKVTLCDNGQNAEWRGRMGS